MTIRSKRTTDAAQPAGGPKVKRTAAQKTLYYGTPRRAAKSTTNLNVPVDRVCFLDAATSAVTLPGGQDSLNPESNELEPAPRVEGGLKEDVRVAGKKARQAEKRAGETGEGIGYQRATGFYGNTNQLWPYERTLPHIPEGPPLNPRALRRQGAMQNIPGHGKRGIFRWVYPLIKFLRVNMGGVLLPTFLLLLRGLDLFLGFVYDHRVAMSVLYGLCIVFYDFLWEIDW